MATATRAADPGRAARGRASHDAAPPRRVDPCALAVVVLGLAGFAIKCAIAWPIRWIGDTDAAAFAEMADSVLHGKGFSAEFLQYAYFYSPLQFPGIVQPEAHYPPLYSLLIVPFQLLFGHTAFVAKAPGMFVSSVLLPVSLFLLTRRLSGTRAAGVAAALGALVFPNLVSRSLIPDEDAIFPFVLVACCHLLLRALESPRWFYVAGAFFGLSWYAKGTGLFLLPVFLVACVLRNGWGVLRQRLLWRGFGLALLVMLPWMARNTAHFGNPIFSTQQYSAGHVGFGNWEEGAYSLFWDTPRPSLASKLWNAGPRGVWRSTTSFAAVFVWWSFVDIGRPWAEFSVSRFYTFYTGLPAAVGLVLFACACLARAARGPTHRGWLARWYNPDLHVLWSVGAAYIGFLSLCWEPLERLAHPFIALNMAIGWTTCVVAVSQLVGRSPWAGATGRVTSGVVGLAAVPVLVASMAAVRQDVEHGDFPYGEGREQSWMDAGRWIHDNLPGSITMFREPAQLHYYSGEKAIQIPLADLADVFTVMRFYHPTHLIPNESARPALEPWVKGDVPGLRLVYDKGIQIYEIQYPALPSP